MFLIWTTSYAALGYAVNYLKNHTLADPPHLALKADMILRSWICENARCNEWFDSYESNPECPKCRCVRVSWRPAGGHVGGPAKDADKELRALADVFRMNDIHSAEQGRAAKKVNLPPPASANPANVHTFSGGFSAAINPAVGAQCVPTANKIDYKVKATPGSQLAPNGSFPAIRSNTAIEAAHKGGR